jgi:DNA-binding MarR family transcriptional regulator/predicted GNAT family acetyltransferase
MDMRDDRSDVVLRFARFCERRFAALDSGLAGEALSPAERRVLRALDGRAGVTAGSLAGELGADAGHLSRVLQRLERGGLVERSRSNRDARQRPLALTEAGRAALAPIEAAARERARALLAGLSDVDQHRAVAAMHTLQRLLGEDGAAPAPYALRPHRPGDIGWIVHRHGALYAQEYGFDETFEGFVAEIAAGFVKSFDPKRERCWIAEKDGEIVGSVLLVGRDGNTARLQLLYVEPKARGLGIGRRFVDEAIRFARAAGYGRVSVWTNDVQRAARRVYGDAGFERVGAQPRRSFGQDLVEEVWEFALQARP